jgi:hypothetical protein
MPTWEKLVEKYEGMKDAGIHLAQVNCAVNGGKSQLVQSQNF